MGEAVQGAKDKRTPVDWEAVEREYRAGIKTLRQIADEAGVVHGAINKRAKKNGWSRDLSAKVAQRAEDLVSKSLVSKEVSKERLVSERQVVETNAQMLADKVINQREDIKRARNIVNKLFAEVEAECDHKEDFERIGELLAAPDANGKDRLNDLYRAAISLPERVRSAKALSEALKVLIELERRVLKLDDQPPINPALSCLSVEFVSPSAYMDGE